MDSILTELDPNALYIASLGAGATAEDVARAVEDSVGDLKNVPPQLVARVRADILGKVAELQARFLPPAEMREAYARILTAHMTSEELVDVAAFARTPAGRHFMADRRKIDADIMAFVMQRQSAMLDELVPWSTAYGERLADGLPDA